MNDCFHDNLYMRVMKNPEWRKLYETDVYFNKFMNALSQSEDDVKAVIEIMVCLIQIIKKQEEMLYHYMRTYGSLDREG